MITTQDMASWCASPGVTVDGTWTPILPSHSREAAQTFYATERNPLRLSLRRANRGFTAVHFQALRLVVCRAALALGVR